MNYLTWYCHKPVTHKIASQQASKSKFDNLHTIKNDSTVSQLICLCTTVSMKFVLCKNENNESFFGVISGHKHHIPSISIRNCDSISCDDRSQIAI